MNLHKYLLIVYLSLLQTVGWAQSILKNETWKLSLNRNGTIKELLINRHGKWDSISVRQDTCMGFSWYGEWQDKHYVISLNQISNGSFAGEFVQLKLGLSYELINDRICVKATIKNVGTEAFKPEKMGLIMGIDNYMAGYPQWNNIYFPTLLRCEKTHFWGYMMNPNGNILGIASPDPIASWSLNYNIGYGTKNAVFGGHRIYSANLDLINSGPLPKRNPQTLSFLQPGESKSWTIFLTDIPSLQNVTDKLSNICEAPLFNIKYTTLEPGKTFEINVTHTKNNILKIRYPSGQEGVIHSYKDSANKQFFRFTPKQDGLYTLHISDNGKFSEAMVSVRKPWGWYLQKAQDGALKYTQKASWNGENWYGFFSAYLAQYYYPDDLKLKQTNGRFQKVMSIMYDTAKGTPNGIINASRIQNTSTTISILVDKYRASKNISHLLLASKLADHIILPAQDTDGAYRNGHTHYTSVIYVAKSILELAAEEKKLSALDPEWKARYDKHYTSAKRAIDQLMKGFTAIETEGEATYEDGMVSCTALQIGAFALLQDNPKERERYTKMAEYYLTGHQCLTQLVVPDSRQRNGTLRFWEAQYDVLLGSNMISSPHGWSAWRAYATYYLYLLTGKQDYLVQTMNALGSCVQVIDNNTGKLRWAFITDPYVKTVQLNKNFPNTGPDKYQNNQYKAQQGETRPVIIGEQYVDMIADWFYGNSSDNDVHEIFKCVEEIALGKAYVIEQQNGELLTYNCSVTKVGNKLVLHSTDDRLTSVHINMKNSYEIEVKNWQKKFKCSAGMEWLEK